MRQSPFPTFCQTRKWAACLIVASTALTSTVFMSVATAVPGEDLGMLLLYSKAQNLAVRAALPRLKDEGCTLWRSGSVAGAQGSFDIGAPNRFVILACASETAATAQRRKTLAPLLQPGKNVRLVEGVLKRNNPGQSTPRPQGGPAYIIKLSRYTNLDPKARSRDLEKLFALASDRPDAWKNDGFIAVSKAFGMPTPDEVVIIHYDTPQQGARFRDNNLDIMKLVGAFNKRHLIEYTYISAAPDK
ncbi:MAG: hypothetical protein ACTSY1_07015 [Alphaproteobacteria bacterium]